MYKTARKIKRIDRDMNQTGGFFWSKVTKDGRPVNVRKLIDPDAEIPDAAVAVPAGTPIAVSDIIAIQERSV